jgi:hypothetical protein
MEIIKDNGTIYTQNVDDISIEERVFFREGIGVNINNGDYRPATPEELEARAQWERAQEAEAMVIMGMSE